MAKVFIGNIKGPAFTYEDFTPEQLADLKGKDGKTPVKGVDYLTEQDVRECAEEAAELVDTDAPVSAHNTATDAHNDIRLYMEGLAARLNALADSDDTTLDQLSEVVAYIKANRGLIESVTTSKVSVADIIDNLTTNVANKPLSAAQGVVLKALIDAITVPTKVSQLENDSNYLTKHQSLAGYATETWVNNAIDGISIGGRNLLRNTRTFEGWTKSANITAQDGVITWAATETPNWSATTDRDVAMNYSEVRGKEVTVSFEVRCDEYAALNGKAENGLILNLALHRQGAGSRYRWNDKLYFSLALSDQWERVEYTFTASDSFFSSGEGDVIPETDKLVLGFYNYAIESVQVRNVKLERGNKATDWTPAVEDMATISDIEDAIRALEADIVTVYSGAAPDSSVGENGDIYLVLE